jgi:hypothetical protein
MTHDFPTIPPFSSLTPADHPSHPYSVWAEPTPASSPSAPDPLGKLRLLTPAVVALAAKEEIRTGLRVSLDLTISTNAKTVGGRAVPERHVVRIDGGPATEEDAKARGEVYQPVHDDIVHFNTQVSGDASEGRSSDGGAGGEPPPLLSLSAGFTLRDSKLIHLLSRRVLNGTASIIL